MKKQAIGENAMFGRCRSAGHEGVAFDDPLDFQNMPDNIGTLGILLDKNGVRESGATG